MLCSWGQCHTVSKLSNSTQWCQRSYTKSSRREKHHKGSCRPVFLQIRSRWKGLSLTESWTRTKTRHALLLGLRKSPAIQILYMGGTIIPGIAALWERGAGRGRKGERRGREVGELAVEKKKTEKKKTTKGQSCNCWVSSVITKVT